MTAATPQSNLNRITALEGDMKALRTALQSEIRIQNMHVQQIKENSIDIKNNVEKLTQHCTDLYSKTDTQNRDLAAVKQKIRGHEDLCAERDKRIAQTIETGFESIKHVRDVEEKAANKEDNNKAWRYGVYITIIIAVVGWVIALFH